ncbi:MAG: STAS/SEC14 domain-containing protein [Desulfobaccales bacterium]
MLEILPESEGNIVGVKATGTFNHQEFHEFLMPRLREIVKEHGQVRLLFCLEEDFQGFDLETIKNEAGGSGLLNDFQKIAVAGGSWLLGLQMSLIAPLLNGALRHFSRAELPEAWTWIRS